MVYIPLGTKVWRSLACPLPGRKGDTRKAEKRTSQKLMHSDWKGLTLEGQEGKLEKTPWSQELRDLEVNSSDGV